MGVHPQLDLYTRVYSITGSEHCKIDVDTLLYKWSYDQFLPLEVYTLFQEDRRVWAERQQETDNKKNQG